MPYLTFRLFFLSFLFNNLLLFAVDREEFNLDARGAQAVLSNQGVISKSFLLHTKPLTRRILYNLSIPHEIVDEIIFMSLPISQNCIIRLDLEFVRHIDHADYFCVDSPGMITGLKFLYTYHNSLFKEISAINVTGDECFNSFCRSLRCSTHLGELVIERVSFNQKARTLIKKILPRMHYLKNLTIDDSGNDGNKLVELLTTIFIGHKKLHKHRVYQLESLTLTCNNMTNSGLRSLIRLIKGVPTLTNVDIYGSSITPGFAEDFEHDITEIMTSKGREDKFSLNVDSPLITPFDEVELVPGEVEEFLI